jgi:hypothetical protein
MPDQLLSPPAWAIHLLLELGAPYQSYERGIQKTAFDMNHHGAVVNAEFLQHGGRGNISVMDVTRMVKRESDNTPQALTGVYDLGWFGGVGLAVLPDVIIGSAGEGWLAEAGSNRISIIDRRTGGLRGQIQMPLTDAGVRQPRPDCPPFPVPFKTPTPAPVVATLAPANLTVAGPIRTGSRSARGAMARRISFPEMAGPTM